MGETGQAREGSAEMKDEATYHQKIKVIMEVAEALAERAPLTALDKLYGMRNIGYRQFNLAYANVDEAMRLLAVKLINAARDI